MDKDDISGWWAEDLSELGIDLYWRTMIVVKSCDKVSAKLVGDALRIYASKWLQNVSKNLGKMIKIMGIALKGPGGAPDPPNFSLRSVMYSRAELAQRIGTQLDEATVQDLLIPSGSCSSNNMMMTYDVEVVLTILEHFMLQSRSPPTSPPRVKGRFERHRRSRSENNVDFEVQESRRCSSTFHNSKIKVAKLVDGYLKEISKDVNMPLSKFTALVEVVPDFARLDHDDLYRAIDNYLKVNSGFFFTLICTILISYYFNQFASNKILH
ncbi:putative NPH3 domain-containing protein [Helianthus annuus]|nr:putative NPH3 domain-containing protein [Helianthus annuus]